MDENKRVWVIRTYLLKKREYRFVLVNERTGERTDLSTEFVSDYNLDDDGSCPDVWSSDAAQDEALSVLGYSVKIVKN